MNMRWVTVFLALCLVSGSSIADATAVQQAPPVSSTAIGLSCLRMGYTCTGEQLAADLANVKGEIARLEKSGQAVDLRIKRSHDKKQKAGLEEDKRGIDRQLIGLRRVKCRLSTRLGPVRPGTTGFSGPGR